MWVRVHHEGVAAFAAAADSHVTGELAVRAGKPTLGGAFRNHAIILVPRAGLEPARGCPRRILSPLRLPFRHLGLSIRGADQVILGEGDFLGNEADR